MNNKITIKNDITSFNIELGQIYQNLQFKSYYIVGVCAGQYTLINLETGSNFVSSSTLQNLFQDKYSNLFRLCPVGAEITITVQR